MTKSLRAEYQAAVRSTVSHYERIRRRYIHTQMSGDMLMALQREKNEELARLTAYYKRRQNDNL